MKIGSNRLSGHYARPYRPDVNQSATPVARRRGTGHQRAHRGVGSTGGNIDSTYRFTTVQSSQPSHLARRAAAASLALLVTGTLLGVGFGLGGALFRLGGGKG